MLERGHGSAKCGCVMCGGGVVSSCVCEVVKQRSPTLASKHVGTRHGHKEVANFMQKMSSSQQCGTDFCKQKIGLFSLLFGSLFCPPKTVAVR